MATTTSTTEERALALLGEGLGPEIVASTIGVSTSAISQLLSRPDFAAKVAELRFTSTLAHSERDKKYDSLEDKLLDKLENCLAYMVRPMEILKSIQVINQAKRRGSSTPEALLAKQTVVSLVMPTQIIQHFTTNVNNQVIKAGEQELITVQSANMQKLLNQSKGNHDVQDALPAGTKTLATSSSAGRSS